MEYQTNNPSLLGLQLVNACFQSSITHSPFFPQMAMISDIGRSVSVPYDLPEGKFSLVSSSLPSLLSLFTFSSVSGQKSVWCSQYLRKAGEEVLFFCMKLQQRLENASVSLCSALQTCLVFRICRGLVVNEVKLWVPQPPSADQTQFLS